jgi:hypothetical protein
MWARWKSSRTFMFNGILFNGMNIADDFPVRDPSTPLSTAQRRSPTLNHARALN